MLTWNLETDQLMAGQWLKGRVYEQRCDLSPSGEYVVVFAAKHKGPVPTWTAISRPPYFTALVAFRNDFGAWGGGGLFDSEYSVSINHGSQLVPLEGAVHPRRFAVSLLRAGRLGEDDPVRHLRMERDGWLLTSPGESTEHPYGSPIWFEFTAPRIYARKHPKRRGVRLEQRLVGIKERDGNWYLFEHDVIGPNEERLALGRTDWADWDPVGDLLFAQKGCLFRATLGPRGLSIEKPQLVADLSGYRFESIPPPKSALA